MRLGVLVEDLLPTGDDLRDDREAIAGRGLREYRTVSALLRFALKNPPLGIAIAAGFVQSSLDTSDMISSRLVCILVYYP